ncbi:transketolase [Candidatus Izimaplasma bacterium ZiA1]|uniref:transketolase family protein n=1 Tax=Candidatus Izimoplasma sp. ZiA1 TaxID=2024899 RepID=UPI000BAA702E|nr:transketolase [Candidatus Izimaplasma bacterium ZiA1]
MSILLKQVPALAKEEMRKVYSNTMSELANENKNIVLMEADLMGAIATKGYMDAHPDRFINVGIMEQHMMGLAAGLSVRGMVPFVHTFGPFATRRSYDQVFLSLGYAGLNAKIIGSDAGISASHNGGTHMPFEDIGLMRLIPNATVLEMSDHVMFDDVLKQVTDTYGLHYIRIVRKNMVQLYEAGSKFEIGKGITLREGNDAVIIATGIMIAEALKASEELKKEGINVGVVDMFTIKPLDTKLVKELAKSTKLIVTAENHNIIGGLGSAVLEALEDVPSKVKRVGVNDLFGQVGPQDFLQEEYKLTSKEIIRVIKENL